MKKLTPKQKAKLDRESQSFKCLVCDEEQVRWNGEQWECKSCGFLYSGMIMDSLIK